MRPGGEARTSDQADGFADFDVLARAHEHLRQMQVHGFIAIGVRDFDHVSLPALAPGKGDAAAADSLYRSADWRAVVGSEVRAIRLQDGMEARVAEMGGHLGPEFQRRAE